MKTLNLKIENPPLLNVEGKIQNLQIKNQINQDHGQDLVVQVFLEINHQFHKK